MPLLIARDDLATFAADALVVTANPSLRIKGTVGAAVAEVAGAADLQVACDAIGGCEVGDAVLTPAFAAPARHIVHAVGPVWRGGDSGEAGLLAQTLRRALTLAWEAGDRSVALPLVSAGTNGYPVREALAVHTAVITDFLTDHELEVTLILYDRRAVIAGTGLELDIQSYIDDVYVETRNRGRGFPACGAAPRDPWDRLPTDVPAPAQASQEAALEDLAPISFDGAPEASAALSFSELENRVAHLDLSFSQTLLHLIDHAGKTDAEVYKRANVSRQLFSKIRSDPQYRPTKRTVVAFAVALELSLEETDDLLERAGFALSHSRLFDVIVEYFIERGIYDAFAINEVLYAYDQELLGS